MRSKPLSLSRALSTASTSISSIYPFSLSILLSVCIRLSAACVLPIPCTNILFATRASSAIRVVCSRWFVYHTPPRYHYHYYYASLSLSPRIISLYYSSVIGVALSATLSLEAEVSSAIGATSPPSSSLDGSSSLIGTASSALLSLEAFSAFGVAEDEGDACGEIGSTRSTSALQKKHRLLLSKWRVIQLHQRQHQRNTVNNTSFETFAQIRAR